MIPLLVPPFQQSSSSRYAPVSSPQLSRAATGSWIEGVEGEGAFVDLCSRKSTTMSRDFRAYGEKHAGRRQELSALQSVLTCIM